MKITNVIPLKIYLKDKGISSIDLAYQSLFRDLSLLFISPISIDNEDDADIVLKIEGLSHNEEYCLEIKNNKITIAGHDDLGLIFGIYTFLEEILHISPSYLMEGLRLENRSEMTLNDTFIHDYPKTRFRGLFINDEDLLSKFKSSGKRNIDYEYYQDIIHPDMMAKIAETILRYKMNLIIPSSLIDITNPDEAALVDICSSYGLYISQHHIEPLGVSKYGFTQYAKKHHLKEDFSYLTNHDNLLHCWEEYIQKWAQYPRIIFQIGLRGGSDRPVWENEKMSSNMKDRGQIISSAMNEQFALIKKYYPYEMNVTSTLWMEGADLLKGGYLKLPKEVTLIFSDVGMSQLFGDDFFILPRAKDIHYGIYYHAAYWHTGPHLGEAVLPDKMKYCYDLARQYHSDDYCLINAANIKEFVFSIYLHSQLTWYLNISLEEIYQRYASLYFKNKRDQENYIKAIKMYYSSFHDVGEEQYERFCQKYHFSYHRYQNLPFPVVSMNDGMFKSIIYCFYYEQREKIKTIALKNACVKGFIGMKQSHQEFKKLAKRVPPSYRIGFNEHWTYQSLYYLHLFCSGIALYDATELLNQKEYDKAEKLLMVSSRELKKILKDRKRYFIGEYQNWFSDERKINISFLSQRVLEELPRAKEVQEKKNS